MAQQKQNIVSVGPGQMNQFADRTCNIIASNRACDFWASGVTYTTGNVVEYSGSLYRSLQAGNIGQQPNITPDYWRQELLNVKDGDVHITVLAGGSDIQQRSGGMWRSMAGQPLIMALVDGQVAPAVAFQYSAASLPYAVLDFTIRRGSTHGRKRAGKYTILSDTGGSITHSLEYGEVGLDVNVTFVPVLVAGTVRLEYTSAAEGVPIELGYSIKGWV